MRDTRGILYTYKGETTTKNGKTKPPLALVKLLRLLDRRPNLLNEVQAGQSPGGGCPLRGHRDVRSRQESRRGRLNAATVLITAAG